MERQKIECYFFIHSSVYHVKVRVSLNFVPVYFFLANYGHF